MQHPWGWAVQTWTIFPWNEFLSPHVQINFRILNPKSERGRGGNQSCRQDPFCHKHSRPLHAQSLVVEWFQLIPLVSNLHESGSSTVEPSRDPVSGACAMRPATASVFRSFMCFQSFSVSWNTVCQIFNCVRLMLGEALPIFTESQEYVCALRWNRKFIDFSSILLLANPPSVIVWLRNTRCLADLAVSIHANIPMRDVQ